MDLQVESGQKLIFMHEYCKYIALIMDNNVILKEGQSICLLQHNQLKPWVVFWLV